MKLLLTFYSFFSDENNAEYHCLCVSVNLMSILNATLQAQRDRLIREEQMLQEERLAAELEKRKLDSIRDEKMRQQIRETR